MKQIFSWILLSVIVLYSVFSTVEQFKAMYDIDEKIELEESNENQNINETKKIDWIFNFQNFSSVDKIFGLKYKNLIHHSEDDYFNSRNFSLLPDIPPEGLI